MLGIFTNHHHIKYYTLKPAFTGYSLSTISKFRENKIFVVSKKVNCTLVQALRLCTGPTDHRESRGIALPFHDHGTRRG
jgi:hypothetical protein